jgi:hypothetical protein
MPGKRLVQFEKVPHTLEIQERIGEQLKGSTMLQSRFPTVSRNF